MRKAMKTIPNFPTYAITKDGEVWSKPRIDRQGGHRKGKWLKPWTGSGRHLYVKLNTHLSRKVHRLVLETYIGPCPNGMECRHLNGNPSDNRLENLCWGTPKENQQDSIKHGTHSSLRRGDENNRAILCENQVRLIFNAYHDGAYTIQELADHFRVRWTTIYLITLKKNWSHLWIN